MPEDDALAAAAPAAGVDDFGLRALPAVVTACHSQPPYTRPTARRYHAASFSSHRALIRTGVQPQEQPAHGNGSPSVRFGLGFIGRRARSRTMP